MPTFAHFTKPASRSKSAPQEEKFEAVAEGGMFDFVSYFRVPEIAVSVDDNHRLLAGKLLFVIKLSFGIHERAFRIPFKDMQISKNC